jgi:hypothetical protein
MTQTIRISAAGAAAADAVARHARKADRIWSFAICECQP